MDDPSSHSASGEDALSKTKVLIADTRRLFAEALGDALGDRPDLEVIGTFPSHGRQVLNVVGSESPDLVLLDFWIGEMHGATVARLIEKRAPECKVVLLSWFLSPAETQGHLQNVVAMVSKGAGLAEVERVIREVTAADRVKDRHGDAARTDEARGTDADELERLIKLTPREMDVLTLLAFRPKDIAETLKISEKTVRNHINNILRKTEARSAVEAVAIGRRNGIV